MSGRLQKMGSQTVQPYDEDDMQMHKAGVNVDEESGQRQKITSANNLLTAKQQELPPEKNKQTQNEGE